MEICGHGLVLDAWFSKLHNYQLESYMQDIAVIMPSKQPQASLFQVYLRLRPPIAENLDESDRFLTVESPEGQDDAEIVAPVPTHITLQPPNDSRKRAVERFGFTKVFEEGASQLDVFHDTGMESLVRGVLKEGRDGLVATLGVTGSGKVGRNISTSG